MRVFVLCTGRCGSKTFARACSHMSNFSSAHESRCGLHGPNRFAYPDNHVEVDNRLSWILGGLDARFGDAVTYVHLVRDPEAVAASFLRRWNYSNRGGIIEAFAHGILGHANDVQARKRVCRFYVETVTRNIELFLRDKTRVHHVRIEAPADGFEALWKAVGAEGNLSKATAELRIRHGSIRGA